MPYFKYQQASVYYELEGEGTCLTFLHGFLENVNMWKSISKSFNTSYKVLLLDLPGHGKTDNFGYIHTMEFMAELVSELLKHLSISSTFIIGHSMGGYVCCSFLQKFPKMCMGLFLMNSTSRADSLDRKKSRDQAVELVKEDHKKFIQKAIPLLFDQKTKNTFQTQINELISEALSTNKQGILAAIQGMKSRRCLMGTVSKSKVKKHLFLGSNDPILDKDFLVEEAQKNKMEYRISNAGHMSHIECENDLINAIKSFLN